MQNNEGQFNATDKMVFAKLNNQQEIDHHTYQDILEQSYQLQAQLWPYWLQKNGIDTTKYLSLLNDILGLETVNIIINDQIKDLAKSELGQLLLRNNIILLKKSARHLTIVGSTGSDLEWLVEWNTYQQYDITYQLCEINQFYRAKTQLQLELAIEALEHDTIKPLVQAILHYAMAHDCSDIHGESTADHLQIRFRINGLLNKPYSLCKFLRNQVINRLKILSKADVANHRLPQDGYLRIEDFPTGPSEARINFCPTIHGEKWVIRLLPQKPILSLTELGFNDFDLNKIRHAISQPQGLILVTGPTGSSKTSTLYSLLEHINSQAVNIITIEDPVEKQLPQINEMQTNKAIGLDFSDGLKALLRQDPDIIMIGEIRDQATADIALKAAQTGHLVFATLHSNSTAQTISRLLAMGFHPELLSQTIIAIIAQRLARTATESYVTRIPIYECMFLSQPLRKIIETQPFDAEKLAKEACCEGMQTLLQTTKQFIDAGIITQQEAYRVVSH